LLLSRADLKVGPYDCWGSVGPYDCWGSVGPYDCWGSVGPYKPRLATEVTKAASAGERSNRCAL